MNARQQDTIRRAKARISRETRDLPSGKRNRIINSAEKICVVARKAAAPKPAKKEARRPMPPSDLDRLTVAQLRALLRYNEETFDEVAVALGAVAGWRRGEAYYGERLLALLTLAGDLVRSHINIEDALRRAIQSGRE